MKMKSALAAAVVAASVCVIAPLAAQDSKQKPTVKIPEAGVPQIMTIEGNFVRAAYNNEGYVILGYKTANMSVGEEWLLLDIGATVRDGVKAQILKRNAITLDTPDGKLPLPTVEEYRKADLRALDKRANVARDSINYFPPMASQACRIGFFSDLDQRAMPWDQVEISNNRACLGRLYFNIPGGIAYGQYWLNVKFEKSVLRVPFRILTEAEEKTLSKNYSSISKQVKEAFKPKKKE